MAVGDVVVAVLTYRRAAGLDRVLWDLVEHLTAAKTSGSILVVDNDDEPSARSIANQVPGVRYVHEPRPGIVAARNRALDEATSSRLLVFIDDDERPGDGWLDSLVGTWESSGRPAAVVGPVIPEFEVEPDPWLLACGSFHRPRFPTGTEMPAAGTGNLLLDLDVVQSLGIRFDERFASTGGSDTFFTQSLVAAGERIVWCDEAPVVDVVPAARMNRDWVLERAQRMGNSRSRSALLIASAGWRRSGVRARLIAQSAIRIVGGALRLAVGKLTGSLAHQARGARTLRRGCGMLVGAAGGVVVGYHRPPSAAPVNRAQAPADEIPA